MSDVAPTRRAFTVSALAFAGSATLLSACRTVADGAGGDTSSPDTGDGTGDDTGGGGDTAAASDWASGGTASMAGGYADPFTSAAATSCELVCAMTLGPCYAETVERTDISEGYTGLPVRLALRVVDVDCNPVEGMYVDVWHATIEGLYSGADASDMCTEGDSDMLANRYFRGMQRTDANGRVDFDTCFPGWYSGRAVHIHFQVRTGASEGSGEYVTAQLFFDPDTIEEVYATHPEYTYRGQPDTPNDSDKVLGDNDPAPYTLETARQADGAMLAWKTLVIRRSLSETPCEAPESGGRP